MDAARRILLVEDDSILGATISQALRNAGYEVIQAVSRGDEALEIVERDSPDLVLMDIELNGPMDGITAAELIWTTFHIPIIYVTSYATPAIIERAKHAEPFGFLIKPFHLKELYATIETALYKCRMEQALQEANRKLAHEIQERQHAEDALRESSDLFRTLIENQGEGIVFINPDAHFVFANPAAEQMLGVGTGELVDRRLGDFFDHTDVLCPPQAMQEYAQKQARSYEMQLVRPDGESRDVLFTATSRFDQGHDFIGIFGIFRDITERKAIEQALQESEFRFRRISELISDYAYVFQIDKAGTWTREWVTDAFTRITGYSPEEVDADSGWFSLVHPDDHSIFLQHQQALLAGEKVISEYRIVTRHNDVFWLRDYGYPVWSNDLGRVVQVFGAAQDISDQKQAELQMQQLWRRLEFLLTANPAVIYTASPNQEFRLAFVSENVQKLLNYTPDELLDSRHSWCDHVHPEDVERVQMGIARVCETGHDTHEYRVFHKDGSTVWLRDEMVLSRDDADRPLEVIGSWSNITERKHAAEERHRMESQLHQAQRLEALGTLAGGIAHDFNNILGTMLGYTDLLLETASESSQDSVFLARIHRAGKRAKDLVQQILAFSRTHEFQPLELTDITPVVEEALQFIRATIPKNTTLAYTLSPDCPSILANATQIHQVIVNLCLNASHAMKPQGGELAIVLEEAEYSVDQHGILGLTKGRYIKITVTDTGKGMKPAVKERIFEPFFTTKAVGEGTGLGLSVVHGIIKNHHGVIAVESEPEQGTQFRLFFPIPGSPILEDPAVEEPSEEEGRAAILVVDDEPALVKLYEIALTKRGYHVTSLTNSIEALNVFRRQPMAFDLMVIDQDMSDLTGVEFSAQVLLERPDLPIILVTGYSPNGAEEFLKTTGIRQCFMKPLNANDLIQAIRTILAET